MYQSVLAVAIGGAIGSLFRWFLGLRLNGLFPDLPLGTLAANVIAGYIIGVAIACFVRMPQIPPEWRLFVTTGLMGAFHVLHLFRGSRRRPSAGPVWLGCGRDRDPSFRLADHDHSRLCDGQPALESGHRMRRVRGNPYIA